MAKRGTWADHVVVVAMARMLEHDIVIVTSSPSTSENECLTWVIGDTTMKKKVSFASTFMGESLPITSAHITNHWAGEPVVQSSISLLRRQLVKYTMTAFTSTLLFIKCTVFN